MHPFNLQKGSRGWLWVLVCWIVCTVEGFAQLLPNLPDSELNRSLQSTLLENSRQTLRAAITLDRLIPQPITSLFAAADELSAAQIDLAHGLYSLVHARLRMYRDARPLVPYRAQAHYLDAIAYFQEPHYVLAARHFDTAAIEAVVEFGETKDSQYVQLRLHALYWKAIAFMHYAAYEQAEQSFRQLLAERSPFNVRAYIGIATIAEFHGDYQRALLYYDSVIAISPKGSLAAAAYIRAAQQLILLRQPRQALQRLAAAEQLVRAADTLHQELPVDAGPLITLLTAEAQNQIGQFAEAAERYRAIANDPSLRSQQLRWQAYLGLGWSELNQARYSAAIAAYQVVIDSVVDVLSLQRAQALLFRAVATERSGNVLQAIEQFDALIADEAFPLRAQALIERGQIEYERRQFSTAALLFDRAYRNAGDQATMLRALLLRGRAEFDQQHWKNAIRTLTDVLQLAERSSPPTVPKLSLLSAEGLLYRGIAYCNETRYAEAIADLGQFISRYTTHPRRDMALLWLAESYERSNMVDNAVATLQQLLNIYPNSAYREEALYHLGWGLFRLRRFEEATATFDRLLSEFPRTSFAMDVTLRKADISYLTKKYAEAARLYRQVAKTSPQSDDGEYALYQVAQSLYRLGDYNNAAEQFRLFVRNFPESPIADDALYNIAWIRMLQGRWSDAISLFETLIRSYRQSELVPFARFYIAQCTYNSGQYVRAIDLYRQFLAEYPTSPMVGQAIEAIQDAYINLGQDSLAVEIAKEFVENNPSSEHSAQVLLRTTDIFVRNRDYAAAIREYERFLEQYPDSRHVPEALYGLFKSLLAVGNRQQADSVLRRLEQKYPQSNYTELAMSDLASHLVEQAFTQQADSLFRVIMSRYPNSESFSKAAFERANIALQRGDTVAALALLDTARTGTGEYAHQAAYRLGMWYRQRNSNDSARAMFRSIIAYNDNPLLAAEATYRIAELWQRQGNCTAAADTFTIVLDRFEGIEDWYTLALLGLAECSEAMGNLDRARQLYQTLMILRPDDDFGKTAAARRRRLEKRR